MSLLRIGNLLPGILSPAKRHNQSHDTFCRRENGDRCEQDFAEAFRLNVQTTRNLTDWILDQSPLTRFVYISTDQVYDGAGPHAEIEAAPINVYGLTKLWAEDLACRLPKAIVLRTNFFGLAGAGQTSFVDWLIAGLESGGPITLFEDVLFNPLHVDDLCDIVIALLGTETNGALNVGATGPGLSKAAFGALVGRALDLDCSQITLAQSASAGLIARRPSDMRMSVEKCERILTRQLPTIADGIERLRTDYHSLR